MRLNRTFNASIPIEKHKQRTQILHLPSIKSETLVECTLGILNNKWRILHSSVWVLPGAAVDIVKSSCMPHNFVRR